MKIDTLPTVRFPLARASLLLLEVLLLGEWFRRKSGSDEHPWLTDVEELLTAFGHSTVRSDGTIQIDLGPAVTVVQFRRLSQETSDGASTSGTFRVATSLGNGFPDELWKPEILGTLNTMSALGAAIPVESPPSFGAFSRLTVYEGDVESRRLYCSLLAVSAMTNASVLTRTVVNVLRMDTSLPQDPIKDDGPSRWGGSDFRQTERMLSSVAILSTASERRLTAEIPWDEGAVSAMAGDGRTALLQMETEIEHPSLGAGMLAKLTLPLNLTSNRAVDLANSLNLHEREAIDAPPFFGAWCVRDDDIHFASFYPNLLHIPGLTTNIAVWMMHRTAMAKVFLTSRHNIS